MGKCASDGQMPLKGRPILFMTMIFLLLPSSAHAQAISIESINPLSITEIKNVEFFTAITYTITGTFDICSLRVDETTLSPGWQLTETNPSRFATALGDLAPTKHALVENVSLTSLLDYYYTAILCFIMFWEP
jgi:hypothetical protein